jgi:hypothetical protein
MMISHSPAAERGPAPNKKPSETDLTSSAAVASFEKAARAYTAKITKSKQAATEALVREGIYTGSGRLAAHK